MNTLLCEAAAIEAELIALRRDLHRHPELGRHEEKTAQRIEQELQSLGIPTRRIAETGVVGILRGNDAGRTIALRADIDALPIQEETALPFASKIPDVMHACGHDLHAAALIGAAKLLNHHRNELHGEVRFFFQPDEEGDGGAQRMIDEGCMKGVDAVFGAHAAPELPIGTIGVRFGNAYAASNPFDIRVHGRSSHGAEPHLGRDVIVAASAIVGALQTLISRELNPVVPAVISIGSFHAGTARNIIADEACLNGIIRCYGSEMRKCLAARVEELVLATARAYGVQAEITLQWGYAGVVNDSEMTRRVQMSAARLLGESAVINEPTPSLTTEDFGAFQECAPGSYWHFGVGKPDVENAPLHSPCFNPDESALKIAAALHAQIALDKLK